MNPLGLALTNEVTDRLKMLRGSDPLFALFATKLQARRDELLHETMKSGVSDARATELRYIARGYTEILDLL